MDAISIDFRGMQLFMDPLILLLSKLNLGWSCATGNNWSHNHKFSAGEDTFQ